MVKDRVEYFESNDLMYGYNLDKIETISIPTYDSININDAIEFYEIKKYFDDGVRSKNWTDEEYKSYIQKSKSLFSLSIPC